ncbi:MAG: pyridoxal phosphate-dependent decarboxylase family protein [Acidimicrobiales bacterium]
MHAYDPAIDAFAQQVFTFSRRRASEDVDGIALGHPLRLEELDALVGPTVSDDGIGAQEALRLFTEVLEPACLSVDFPRYLAFVPAAPTEVSILADLVVSACSIYAGSWLEGAGAVWAENQGLRWLADCAGLPPEAGGCFVSGGTLGNLSALVAARAAATVRVGRRPPRWAVVAAESAHSSIATAAAVMDADLVTVPGDRLTGTVLAPVLDAAGDRVFAVVATAGTTNLGLIDDLASVADVCASAGVWFHVDAAYGGAALVSPTARPRFDGVERADSLIVDPHKWLFAPFDACALLYRRPDDGKACHAQHASYLAILSDRGDWNPSDFAVHLSRRARGLPFWFSVAAYGTRAYAAAVDRCLAVAQEAAELIRTAGHLALIAEPELSIVAFRRRGWGEDDYRDWSTRMLESGQALVVPSEHRGEPMLRLCIVNPRTSVDDIRLVVDSLG